MHSRLLTLMLALDLFCGEAFIRLCIRVTNPNVEKGRAFSGGSSPSDKGGGGGGGGDKKNFFRPFGPHFGRKIRGGPWIRHWPCNSQNPRAWMLSRASAALFVPVVSTSPFISWGAGSIWLSVRTIFRISIFCYNSVACDERRYTYKPISSV